MQLRKKTAYGKFGSRLLSGLLAFCALSFSATTAWAFNAALPQVTAERGQTVSLSLTFANNVDAVFAVDTAILYDTNVLENPVVQNGSSFSSFFLSAQYNRSGANYRIAVWLQCDDGGQRRGSRYTI